MIPADAISFQDDTAWLVYEDQSLFSVDANRLLDRPCDRCYGDRTILVVNQGEEPCPARCIDGRHTFLIEVHDARPGRLIIKPYRVSIVPGMVLPIVDEAAVIHGRVNMPAKCITSRFEAAHIHDGTTVPSRITLPSAAKPGMWAVKLKVAT